MTFLISEGDISSMSSTTGTFFSARFQRSPRPSIPVSFLATVSLSPCDLSSPPHHHHLFQGVTSFYFFLISSLCRPASLIFVKVTKTSSITLSTVPQGLFELDEPRATCPQTSNRIYGRICSEIFNSIQALVCPCWKKSSLPAGHDLIRSPHTGLPCFTVLSERSRHFQ